MTGVVIVVCILVKCSHVAHFVALVPPDAVPKQINIIVCMLCFLQKTFTPLLPQCNLHNYSQLSAVATQLQPQPASLAFQHDTCTTAEAALLS